jgi:uncharacterized caspase-like protein
MPRIPRILAALIGIVVLATALTAAAEPTEKRIALVVGNAGYQAGALTTPANDAGLIAQTLQAAGFDVVGARDLDQDSLRRALRDFLDKAAAAGPDAVAFVYFSGYGLQLEGENYFVPVDAKIARDTDVAVEALRVSDYTRPLAALKLKASIVVLDAARAHPFARDGAPLAGGLALVEPETGMLIALSATPGTVAPEAPGPYGPYAQALAEMMREGGLALGEVFDHVRLRVNDATQGAEVAWHASKVEAPFIFFERAPDAPPPALAADQTAAIRAKPIRDLGAQDAYIVALEHDTLQGYGEFLDAYPNDPLAPRVRAIVAARREAITWRRSRLEDSPPAYWSYLRRYPEGPHAFDARRRLAYLSADYDPPPAFIPLAYDVPPPPPDEFVYFRRPVLVFSDPVFAFAPPPPPVIFLATPAFVVLAPPPPPIGVFVLPVPVYTPVPVWVRPPVYITAPPANNVIFANVHNTVVINNVNNTVTVTNAAGQSRTITPAAAPGPAGRAAAIGPALPPSVATKAATLPAAPASAAPAASTVKPLTPLPGTKGSPLPSPTGTTAAPPPAAAAKSLAPATKGKTATGSPAGSTTKPAASATSAATTPPGPKPPSPALSSGTPKPGTPKSGTPKSASPTAAATAKPSVSPSVPTATHATGSPKPGPTFAPASVTGAVPPTAPAKPAAPKVAPTPAPKASFAQPLPKGPQPKAPPPGKPKPHP